MCLPSFYIHCKKHLEHLILLWQCQPDRSHPILHKHHFSWISVEIWILNLFHLVVEQVWNPQFRLNGKYPKNNTLCNKWLAYTSIITLNSPFENCGPIFIDILSLMVDIGWIYLAMFCSNSLFVFCLNICVFDFKIAID